MSLAFLLDLPFVGLAKPFNPGIGAQQLARCQTEHIGDIESTSQELNSGICATQKLACGFSMKEAQLEFLVAFLESTNRAVARV